MSNTPYQHSIARPLSDIIGDRLSAISMGVLGDGATDDGPAITAAIATLVAQGGRNLYFPGGRVYVIKTPVVFPAGLNNMTISSDRLAAVFLRSDDMPTGKGVFDLQGAFSVTFRDIAFDGNTTTPVGLLDSAYSGDPMAAVLTKNSTIWVHGGGDIVLDHVYINHTGGYAVLLDATAANIDRVRIIHPVIENCYPNLFGPTGDLTYGSWNAGIHYEGDGASFRLNDLLIQGGRFLRISGNVIWGHSPGFGALHTNIKVLDNYFEDIGRDPVELGATVGGSVAGNSGRRIGYVVVDDTTNSVPKWRANNNAVAIDTTGLVMNVDYSNNNFISINGGCLDLDGYSNGTVSNNSFRNPVPGDPEYTRDLIGDPSWGAPRPSGFSGTWNPRWDYGAQTNNSSGVALQAAGLPPGGDNVTIVGNTFIHLGGGSINLYGCRHCHATDNNIVIFDTPTRAPITIGNVGTPDYWRSYDNVVQNNRITGNPSAPLAAIQELDGGFAFQTSDKNWVFGNKLFGNGNLYEFYKDPNTVSTTAVTHSTVSAQVTSVSSHTAQREGRAATAVLKFYSSDLESGSTQTSSFMHLQDYSSSTRRKGLLNISRDGAAASGNVSTGNRQTTAFDDTMLTGHSYVDGFIALADTTLGRDPTTHAIDDPNANLLVATTAILAYDSLNSQVVVSTAVSGGKRVYVPLASSAGADKQVQFNKAGVQGADSAFIYDYTNHRLGVGPLVSSGAPGATLEIGGNAWFTNQTPSNIAFIVRGAASQTGNLQEWRDSGGNALVAINPNGALFLRQFGSFPTSVGGSTYLAYDGTQLGVDSPLWVRSGSVTSALKVFNSTGTVFGGIQSGALQVNSTAFNAVDVIGTGGGVRAERFNVEKVAFFGSQASSPAGPGGSYSYLAHKSGSTYWYWNPTLGAAASVDLAAVGAGTVAGSDKQIQYNKAGALFADANHTWDYTNKVMTIFGTPGQVALAVGDTGPNTAYILSHGGYLTDSSNSDAIQAPFGGVKAVSLTLSSGAPSGTVYPSITLQSSGLPTKTRMFGPVVNNVNTQDFYFAKNLFYSGSSWVADDSGKTTALFSLNSAITGAGGWLYPIAFWVGLGGLGTQAMSLHYGGNVGIGLLPTGTTGAALQVQGSSGVAGISLVTGYIQADGGFVTASASGNAIQAPSGGVTASTISATNSAYNGVQNSVGGIASAQGIYLKGTASPTNPGSGFGGLSWTGTTSSYRYWNGSSWATVNFASVGGGVTSVSAGTGISVSGTTAVTVSNTGVTFLSGSNITVSAGTGSVLISIPQNVATSSSVAFQYVTVNSTTFIDNLGNITMPGVLHISGSSGGVNITGDTAYNSIQTVGGVSTSQGYFVGTTQVINSSGVFTALFSGVTYTGETYTYVFPGFTVNGVTYTHIVVINGIIVQHY